MKCNQIPYIRTISDIGLSQTLSKIVLVCVASCICRVHAPVIYFTQPPSEKTSFSIFHVFSSIFTLSLPSPFIILNAPLPFPPVYKLFLVSLGLHGIVDEHFKILIFFYLLLTITLFTITMFFVGLYPVGVHPGTIFPLC